MKENICLRRKLQEHGIPFWKIGRKLGVSENTIIRWLRVPLDQEKQRKIDEAIDAIMFERGERV